jgi:KipI family sensor histidine kinase inhibitor
MKTNDPFPRYSPVGESGLLLELSESLDPSVNARVLSLDAWLGESIPEGIQTWIPGYVSLLVLYDPLVTALSEVKSWLEDHILSCPAVETQPPRQVEIPVLYGGEEGPDLAYVAEYHDITSSDVIRKHTSQTYRVGMMGFTPGFAYLMGMDPGLATPRLATPRTHVPAGSVGIAGGQTGIYPLDSPGGWQLVGRTDCRLFDPHHEPHFLLSPGDEVRFVAVNESGEG